MKASEIIRIIVFSLIGLALMFLVQRGLYENRLLAITDVRRITTWVEDYYLRGATIVFTASVVAAVSWYVFAVNAKPRNAEDVASWRVVWWLLSLLPVLSIFIAIYIISDGSKQALGSLVLLFTLDALLLYWLTTAASSPKALMYIPPGAFILRRLFRD
ncbi:hypothetical protein NIES4071_60280 [Calothrix sp. NIES-4071]|nr:hypothetical protein NIES4071_60280 [Calothrix sp. NIES-4071]BAZ60335.1 hypothetical protein NIES4105_60230 [Calothrix sp. NIES-4105]